MRMLVLGGTAWLGRHVAAAAVDRGYAVTCLARGTAGVAPAGVRFVAGDRDDPALWEGVPGEWDAVVDVARQPGHVRRAAAALAGRAGHFGYVSSCSAYADQRTPGTDETAPVLPPLAGDAMASAVEYGAAKSAGEAHVAAAFAGRHLIARAGLIGGPGDRSGRTTYYPERFARPAGPGGAVLVPDVPGLRTQVIDVRDLAAWLVTAAAAGTAGVFNAAGDALPLADHLAVARDVAGHTGPVRAAPAQWLAARGVQPWAGPRSLPLWLEPAYAGMNDRDTARARAAGLVTRPLADTLRDGLAGAAADTQGDGSGGRPCGLAPDDERALLAEWAA
ncbi:reductase [Pilimelia anulata]|uniref:Reductase n=1 Tax=Pilimelia anulata TaxID=53371 RepID=A0A8J3BD11_9ACTN|nr:NAD-dependent epimerase/dehydratase family protein [Pilimelia anulata]GGJ97953.1 reductase [Pilimelia anulata]